MTEQPPVTPSIQSQSWSLAWPMILSNISVPLLGAIDTAILGHLNSAVYIGAVAVGSSILSLLFWAFGFLRMGTTSLVARAFGAADHSACLVLLWRSALLGLALALLLIASQWIIFPLALQWMHAGTDVSELAASYLQIRIFAAPATLINFALIGWFIGCQNTRAPLLIMVSQNLFNILLDWLLIVQLGLNSDGAAIASVIAEYAGLALGLLLAVQLAREKSWLNTQQLWRWRAYIDLLKVNGNLFIRTASLLFTFAFFTSQGARQGDDILAANAILLQLLLLISYGLDGFAHAAEALTGRAIGAKSLTQFYQVCRATSQLALLTAALLSLIFWLWKDPLLGLFTSIETVQTLTNRYYFWIILLPLFGVWCYQLDGIFIGAGQTRAMRDSMLASVILVFLPIWWLCQSLGNTGLWLAFSIFILARGLTLGAYFWRISRNKGWLSLSR